MWHSGSFCLFTQQTPKLVTSDSNRGQRGGGGGGDEGMVPAVLVPGQVAEEEMVLGQPCLQCPPSMRAEGR